MKKMKRIVAATLALTVLFATSVMAQTPREIVSQAYANSADATTMSITGNLTGTVNLMGMEFLQLNADFIMDIDMDLDAGTMMMYMRIPMQISGTDPMTGESMNESIEIAMFMDGATVFVYESTIGWFTDPSMDMGDVDIFAGMNFDEMMAWGLELNEQIMDEITIQFADDQVEGYYVIEQIMNWDDLLNMMDIIFASDIFSDMMAFMPADMMVDLDPQELEMAMAELDDMMDMMLAVLDEIDVDLEMVYRSYIDVETLNFQTYTMNMTLTFAGDLDLGIAGSMEISGNFTMNMDIDYNPTIVWPVIDEYVTLDDLLGELDIYMTSLTFDQANLEERVAVIFDDAAVAVVELAVEDIASFNVFIVNHGNEAVTIMLPGAFLEVLEAGEGFVMQIPAGTLGTDAVLVIEGAWAPLNVETGFRLTNYPLGS
jgi:hypothetical protein